MLKHNPPLRRQRNELAAGCEQSKIIAPFEVQTGFVLYKSRFRKKWSICQLVLRRLTESPHELVRSSPKDAKPGKLYRLEQVRIVNSYRVDWKSSKDTRHGFIIEFHNRRSLVFVCNTEAESKQWISNIQKLSNYSSLKTLAYPVQVDMLPSSQLRFSGSCQMRIKDDDILLLQFHSGKDSHQGQIVRWPFEAIDTCCFQKNHILLTTTRICETGAGLFVFRVHQPEKPDDVCHKILAAMSRSQVHFTSTAQIAPSVPLQRNYSAPNLLDLDCEDSFYDQTIESPSIQRSQSVENVLSLTTALSTKERVIVPTEKFISLKISRSSDMLNANRPTDDTSRSNAQNTVTFADLVGLDYSIRRLLSLFSPPIRRPSTVLLYGPAGCGKKSLVHALALNRSLRLLTVDGDNVTASFRRTINKIGELSESESVILLLSNIDQFDRSSKTELVQLMNTVHNRRQNADWTRPVARDAQVINLIVERLAVVIATTSLPGKVDPSLMTSDQFTEHLYIPVPNERLRQKLVESRLKLTPDTGIGVSVHDSSVEPDARFRKEQIQFIVANTINQSASIVIRLCEASSVRNVGEADMAFRQNGPKLPPRQLSLRKLIKQIIDSNRPKLLKEIESCGEHFTAYNNLTETFLTELLPNNMLVNVWYCFLQLCSDSVKLLDLDGVTSLVTWSFSCIRKYSYSHYQFVIETGSKAAVTGVGSFVFNTRHARQLSELMSNKLNRPHQ